MMDGRQLLTLGLVGGGLYALYHFVSAQQVSTPAPVAPPPPAPPPPSSSSVATSGTAAPAGGVDSVSPTGTAFIKSKEALRLTAYPDGNGYSIGYGHFGASAGQRISQAEAEKLFAADIARVEQTINGAVHTPLSQGEYDAVADFVFNEGAGHFLSSSLLQKLNAGDMAGADAAFSQWVYAGGQQNAALVARRRADAAMFEG